MKQQKVWQQMVVLALLAVFFILLFYTDNKYQTPPPYGKSGRIALQEKDLERRNPIFLIDGWLLTDENVRRNPLTLGNFPTFSEEIGLFPPMDVPAIS